MKVSIALIRMVAARLKAKGYEPTDGVVDVTLCPEHVYALQGDPDLAALEPAPDAQPFEVILVPIPGIRIWANSSISGAQMRVSSGCATDIVTVDPPED